MFHEAHVNFQPTNNTYFAYWRTHWAKNELCHWRWFCNEIDHLGVSFPKPNQRTYVASNGPSASIPESAWSCMGVNKDPYAKFAIKWSGRCPTLESAVELTALDHLLRTFQRQRYFRHFDTGTATSHNEYVDSNFCTKLVTACLLGRELRPKIGVNALKVAVTDSEFLFYNLQTLFVHVLYHDENLKFTE